MNRSARAEAFFLMRSQNPLELPEIPILQPGSPEALAYVDSYKEKHFVVMARALHELLEHACTNRYPDEGRLSNSGRATKWAALADDWRAEFIDRCEDIKVSEAFQQADDFSRLTGRLNPSRFITFEDQLLSGAGTAVITTLQLLRNLPHIISHHAKDSLELSPATIARHPQSAILVRSLAKTSINRAMAAQAALAGEDQPSSWTNFDKVLEPEHFRLNFYADRTASLSYVDFSGLTVPAGYKPHNPIPPTTEPTLARMIPSQPPKIVGCPITLLQGRLAELWNWGVDLVEANGLWEENWPPVERQAA